MNARSYPQPLPLSRPPVLRLFTDAADRLVFLARQFSAWRAERKAIRLAGQAERELARLSVRTLEDIGAPHGLIGQRRWQDEHDTAQRNFRLDRYN